VSGYMTQPKARAPFFVLFGNSVDKIAECYKRYLVSGLRETFGLIGVPIRASMRSGTENPCAPRKRRERIRNQAYFGTLSMNL
jgi:GTPase